MERKFYCYFWVKKQNNSEEKLNMINVHEFELQKRPALDELNAIHLNRAHEETSMESIKNTKLFCAHINLCVKINFKF